MSDSVSLFQSFRSFMITRRLPSPAIEAALRLPEPQPMLKEENNNIISVDSTIGHIYGVTVPYNVPHVMYVARETYLLEGPMKQYDSRIMTLSYGDAVTVAAFRGNYANVQTNKYTGWVEKDALSSRKEEVWPGWVYNVWCDATHETTIKVRVLLKDMFFAGAAGLPLQSTEYVTAVLREDNRQIDWPVAIHRVPGRWHQLLRGVRGIHVGIHAKTDSVMEWTDESGIGHLAYVREVRPDKTIRLSGVGIIEESILESLLLPESLWKEWHPVFIEIA